MFRIIEITFDPWLFQTEITWYHKKGTPGLRKEQNVLYVSYYLIANSPSLNQLEPIELENLTPRGNSAKMVKILTLQPKYRAEYYIVDDITGEMYAHTVEGLIAIKEQAYLDQTVALEATAAEFSEVTSASASSSSAPKLSTDQTEREGALDHSEKGEEVQQKKIEPTSKEVSDQTMLAESLIDSNYLQRKEEALLLHKGLHRNTLP